MKKTLLVMAGDRRMEYCAERLKDDFNVYTYGFSGSLPIWEIKHADILVLPYFSLAGDYLNAPGLSHKVPAVSALDLLKYGGTLFGGGLTPQFLSYCLERDAKVYDFFEDEALTVENARLTAEGALGIVISETESSVKGAKVCITGWGRVAKACAEILKGVGADVIAAARSEKAREDAIARGFNAVGLDDEEALKCADVIINTVPSEILGREKLCLINKEALLVELASAPYGIDKEAAKELGLRLIAAPGLPGKTAPKTAGYLIAETVKRLAKEAEGDA